jgi:hypothetical protein
MVCRTCGAVVAKSMGCGWIVEIRYHSSPTTLEFLFIAQHTPFCLWKVSRQTKNMLDTRSRNNRRVEALVERIAAVTESRQRSARRPPVRTSPKSLSAPFVISRDDKPLSLDAADYDAYLIGSAAARKGLAAAMALPNSAKPLSPPRPRQEADVHCGVCDGGFPSSEHVSHSPSQRSPAENIWLNQRPPLFPAPAFPTVPTEALSDEDETLLQALEELMTAPLSPSVRSPPLQWPKSSVAECCRGRGRSTILRAPVPNGPPPVAHPPVPRRTPRNAPQFLIACPGPGDYDVSDRVLSAWRVKCT